MKNILIFAAAGLALTGSAFAYGAEGHSMVGAIADAKIAGTPTAAKVTALLDGMTLAQAAVIPDEIKGWDKKGPGKGFHLSGHPQIEQELAAFWQANPPAQAPRSLDDSETTPSHHWFHYADVPVMHVEKYADGKAGRSQWDVVHMMRYCTDVLEGKVSENNPRHITKAVAVILLAHYLGDIHQPLHVGAEFFDRDGHVADPDQPDGANALGDQGGNTLFLVLTKAPDAANPHAHLTLHGFWDKDAVLTAEGQIQANMKKQSPDHAEAFTSADMAIWLAKQEPSGWNVMGQADPAAWGEILANDALPLAREAHERLSLADVASKEERGSMVAAGFAREKAMPDGKDYNTWAGEVTASQMDKAGWRLAALLEKTLP